MRGSPDLRFFMLDKLCFSCRLLVRSFSLINYDLIIINLVREWFYQAEGS